MTQADRIEQKLDRLLNLMGNVSTAPLTVEQQAMELAKQGRIEESIALLKAKSKRRSK